MSDNTVDFLPPRKALEVQQGSFTFYVFKIPAKTLLSIAYTSERTQENRTGIQRGLRKDRLQEIGRYLKGETAGPPVLPNTIIVSLSKDTKFDNGDIHIVNRPSAEAFILDGQHRLWAFLDKWSGSVDFDVVVSGFIELEDKFKALIFRTINGEQRKINPSLVYDLIPMLRGEDWVQFEDQRAHDLVEELNTNPRSPWYDKIAMVGGANRIISQSSFITAIKKLLKAGHIFDAKDPDFFEAAIQGELLLLYSKLLADAYPKQWDNKDYLLCKYVGVSATFNVLEMMVRDLRRNNVQLTNDEGLVINETHLRQFINKLQQYDFSAKAAKREGKSYVGEGGINELTKRISELVFPVESN
jgi:DGQHR domain-containing protein